MCLACADEVIEYPRYVRFWPKADLKRAIRDVCFWPIADIGSSLNASRWNRYDHILSVEGDYGRTGANIRLGSCSDDECRNDVLAPDKRPLL